jgi:predicted ATP-dependent serine protease
MNGWKCNRCGQLHTQNPGECRSCGHRILSPASNGELQRASEGVDTPDPIEVEHTVGSLEEDTFESSPDVAVDGSIERESTQQESGERNQGLISRFLSWFR